jgi:hypothetical protein
LKCDGVNLRTGAECSAHGKYAARGKTYCPAHYVTAVKDPKRFREAIETSYRRLARQEIARRAAGAQIDAFPAETPAGIIEANLSI